MKIDARKFVVDPNSVNEEDEEILYDWDDFDQFCDFYLPLWMLTDMFAPED